MKKWTITLVTLASLVISGLAYAENPVLTEREHARAAAEAQQQAAVKAAWPGKFNAYFQNAVQRFMSKHGGGQIIGTNLGIRYENSPELIGSIDFNMRGDFACSAKCYSSWNPQIFFTCLNGSQRQITYRDAGFVRSLGK